MQQPRGKRRGRRSSATSAKQRKALTPLWSVLIQKPQWDIIGLASEALHRAEIPFALGGALALAHYTHRLRNTHDADFFILEKSAPAAINALKHAGFSDYYDHLAYDRGWIFRAVKEGNIVDLIWTTPNRFTQVTPDWFTRAQVTMLKGSIFQVIPVEELIWIKLFVMQRSRCDWPDLMNILRIYGANVDWKHLLDIAGSDVDLLRAMLTLFNWTSPPGIAQLPRWLRKRFDLKPQSRTRSAIPERRRVALLDSRPWYAAFQPKTELMAL